MNEKIKNFTDLYAWKESHQLVLMIYKITKNFPSEEKFGLTNQIRRAVVSITSNIAEGFSRNSFKEKIQFYFIALGSLTEVHNQLIIAKDIHFISQTEFDDLILQIIVSSKLIKGMIRSSNIKNYQ
jgi:four helix bundle protein